MTAPDPRLGAYHPANRQDATDDLIRMLTESADIPGNVRLPREAVNMLLAELRKAQDKIARVEAACDRVINNEDGHKPPGPPHPTREQATAVRIRAAVADATGGGE